MAWHPFHIQAKLLYIAYDVIHTMVIYVDEGINADIHINAHTLGPVYRQLLHIVMSSLHAGFSGRA